MTLANCFVHSACCFRRELALALGGYPDSVRMAQDYALWSAMLRAGWDLANLDRMSATRPDIAIEPKCAMCQGWAQPSMAEYWHIGAIAIRFGRVKPRKLIGLNSLDMIRLKVWWAQRWHYPLN